MFCAKKSKKSFQCAEGKKNYLIHFFKADQNGLLPLRSQTLHWIGAQFSVWSSGNQNLNMLQNVRESRVQSCQFRRCLLDLNKPVLSYAKFS